MVLSLAVLHSWNLFLLIMAIPSLLGGLLSMYLPESPKFLMSRGLNMEALNVFQEIYRRNQNIKEFPIKALANEKYVPVTNKKHEGEGSPVEKTFWTVIKDGLVQMSTIFEAPHLKNCLLVFTMHFGILWSQNTLRLWLPSILAMITDYQLKEETAAFDLCRVIESGTTVPSGNSTNGEMVCSQVTLVKFINS